MPPRVIENAAVGSLTSLSLSLEVNLTVYDDTSCVSAYAAVIYYSLSLLSHDELRVIENAAVCSLTSLLSLEVNLTVYDDTSCVSAYAAVISINPQNQFCAGKCRRVNNSDVSLESAFWISSTESYPDPGLAPRNTELSGGLEVFLMKLAF